MAIYTTNLELKIMESADTLSNVFTQGNYNANKLEEKLGSYLDDLETLPELRTDVNALGGSVEVHTGQISELNSDINDINNDISDIRSDKYKYQYERNGVITEGIIETRVLSAQAIGNIITRQVGDMYYHQDNGYLEINLSNAAGISASENVILVSAEIFSTSGDQTVTQPLSLAYFGGKTGAYGKFIAFKGKNIVVNANESAASVYDGVSYNVVLTMIRENVE